MNTAVDERKLLRPLESGLRVQIVAALHYVLNVCLIWAITTMIAGAIIIIHSVANNWNFTGIIWGILILMSTLIPLIIGVVVGDVIEPNRKIASDAYILVNWRRKTKTRVSKEVHINRVVRIGNRVPKTNTVRVVMRPEGLGEYATWSAEVPSEIAAIMKPGYVARYRRVLYLFRNAAEPYESGCKLVVHDENDKIVAVTDIFNKANRKGAKGVNRDGFRVRKVVAE